MIRLQAVGSAPVGCVERGLGALTDLLDGRDDVRVGAAATDVAVHCLLDVGVRGADVLPENRDGGHDLARSAVSALVAVVLNEGSLHGMKVIGLADAFDGGDLIVRVHDGEREAGVDAATVHVNGAGSALAMITALLGAGQGEVFAQAVEQGGAGVESEGVGLSVDLEIDGYGAFAVGVGGRRGCGGRRGRRRCQDRRRGGGKTGGSEMRKEGAAADPIG